MVEHTPNSRLLQQARLNTERQKSEAEAYLQVPELARRIQDVLKVSPPQSEPGSMSASRARQDMKDVLDHLAYETSHPNSDAYRIGGETGVVVELWHGKKKGEYGNLYTSTSMRVQGSEETLKVTLDEDGFYSGSIIGSMGLRFAVAPNMDHIREYSEILDIIARGDGVELVSSIRTMSLEEWKMANAK